MRSARALAGVGVVVLAALVALAAGSFPGQQEPTPRPSAPSTTADPRQSRPLAGVPLAGRSRLRLLVASEPAPFVVDLDRHRVQLVTGLPPDGGRVVSVVPVGEHAVIVSERVCTGCQPAVAVYGIWRGRTAAVQLGRYQEVAAAGDGRAVWLLDQRTATACTLREVGLDGRPRRPPRPVSCTTKLLGELPSGLLVATGTAEDPWERPTSLVDRAGHRTRLGFPAANLLAATGQLLLTSAEPQAPLTLTNLASHRSWPLGWPSRLRGGAHLAAVHPNGRDIAVGFHGLAAPGEEGYDLWLLHTASRRWQHLPDLPAADVVAKATDLVWTRDGRLVVLTATPTRGHVVAVWRPGQSRLALRPLELPEPSPGTDTLAIWSDCRRPRGRPACCHGHGHLVAGGHQRPRVEPDGPEDTGRAFRPPRSGTSGPPAR